MKTYTWVMLVGITAMTWGLQSARGEFHIPKPGGYVGQLIDKTKATGRRASETFKRAMEGAADAEKEIREMLRTPDCRVAILDGNFFQWVIGINYLRSQKFVESEAQCKGIISGQNHYLLMLARNFLENSGFKNKVVINYESRLAYCACEYVF